ncbi:hypothetical protein ACMYSQ_007014 [Aspergillus niger]
MHTAQTPGQVTIHHSGTNSVNRGLCVNGRTVSPSLFGDYHPVSLTSNTKGHYCCLDGPRSGSCLTCFHRRVSRRYDSSSSFAGDAPVAIWKPAGETPEPIGWVSHLCNAIKHLSPTFLRGHGFA